MVIIHPLTDELCHEASLLEKRCLSTAWSENQLREIVSNPCYLYVTATENGQLLGVGGVICTSPDSCEIFTVAVDETQRGKGIGKSIVSSLLKFCKEKTGDSVFLEVEDGNTSAISLYLKSGFVSVGRRKGFYGGKDAIIMTKQLKESEI